jgi:hypothetical protein
MSSAQSIKHFTELFLIISVKQKKREEVPWVFQETGSQSGIGKDNDYERKACQSSVKKRISLFL